MRSRIHTAAPIAVALAVAAAVGTPAGAVAADTDISVVYSTQNASSAPIDGSYIVHGRVGLPRDDMQVTYTIQAPTVRYPIPVVDYTGSLANTADATYTFRFGCDSAVAPATCADPAVLGQIAAMNTAIAALDGHSVADFVSDVTPIIQTHGGSVPQGVTGTVKVRVLSNEPGDGKLTFHLTEGSGGAAISPTVVAPLSVTEPALAPAEVAPFCAAGLTSYEADGWRYTPTDFGRNTVAAEGVAVDAGIYPDDAAAIPVDPAAVTYELDGVPQAAGVINDAVLALPAGDHTMTLAYTAPDGVAADTVTAIVTVLGQDAPECYTATKVPVGPGDSTDTTDPAEPGNEASEPETGVQYLAATGADDETGLSVIVGTTLVLGGLASMLLARRRNRLAPPTR